MGLFSFLTKKKEQKEDLDKGLEKTKTSVFSRISHAIAGKSKVDDEVLDELEEILITSDVGVKHFCCRLKDNSCISHVHEVHEHFFMEKMKHTFS